MANNVGGGRESSWVRLDYGNRPAAGSSLVHLLTLRKKDLVIRQGLLLLKEKVPELARKLRHAAIVWTLLEKHIGLRIYRDRLRLMIVHGRLIKACTRWKDRRGSLSTYGTIIMVSWTIHWRDRFLQLHDVQLG